MVVFGTVKSARLSFLSGGILSFCLFVFISFFSSHETYGQHARCGFDHSHHHILKSHPKFRQILQYNEQLLQRHKHTAASLRNEYTIPVVVHVIGAGSAEGSGENISDQQIQEALDYTNQLFKGAQAEGFTGPDIGIELKLAKRTPDCLPTNGIIRWDFTDDPTYVAEGVKLESQLGINEFGLKRETRWPNDEYYNIWIVNRIDGEDGTSGSFIAAYAYFPGFSEIVDGTVILGSQFTEGNTTLGHEIGHALSLYHTFEGDFDEQSRSFVCPVDNDCTTDGDRICDTDPHIRSAFTCEKEEINECTGNPLGQVITNHMDYSSCSEQFTEGQKQRMITALTTLRPSLLESRATETPPPLPADAICFPRVEDPNNSFGIGPVRVILNTLDATSETFSTEGPYLDRVCDFRTTVQAGQAYQLEVYTTTNDQKVRVYFDYNNNGDFSDDGELVFSSNKTGAPQIHADTVRIPENPPVVNQVIRMRVVSDLITGNDGPCGTLLYGQTEDYGLTIQGSAPDLPIIQDFTLTDPGITSATMGAQIISNGGGTINEYGIVWSTEANPEISDSQDQKVVMGTDDFLGTFSEEVSGLPEGVEIYARGFATNGTGTAYTSDSTFTLSATTIAETSILSFSGRVQDEQVLLNWRAVEYDNESFMLETSLDGTSWTDLKEVAGAGTSNGVVEYNETDEPNSTGRIFYRIRFLDSSGNTKYSEVIEVNFDPSAIISVYPLPADDGQLTVFIPSFNTNDVRLIITDPIGRVIIEKNYLGQQGQAVEEVFNVSFLQDGMYFLSIRDGDQVIMRRLVIYAGEN